MNSGLAIFTIPTMITTVDTQKVDNNGDLGWLEVTPKAAGPVPVPSCGST